MSEISSTYYEELIPEAVEYEQFEGEEDIAFFTQLAQRAGGPVLDLGCGTGRLSLPLAELGLDVVGLDVSLSMLQTFQRKLREHHSIVPEKIRLVCADMRRFSLRQTFSCAICSSNTLLLMGDEDSIEEALSCTSRHLRRGGLFIIDVAAIDEQMIAALSSYPAGEKHDATFALGDGRKLQRTHSLKVFSAGPQWAKKVSVTYSYTNGSGNPCGQRKEELALIGPEKMLSMVRSSGLDICETFGWYDFRPFSENERKLLIVAKRRE